DFAQVEQDPSVLNLSVFETFFPEKRPFFVEDSRMFVPSFPQMLLFHSRRIGRSPGRVTFGSNDTVVSKPDATTILGAAKRTGKTNGWTFGGLSALTAPEYATIDTPSTAANGDEVVTRHEQLIEPRTSYSVGRIQRDFHGGQSNVGALMTAV